MRTITPVTNFFWRVKKVNLCHVVLFSGTLLLFLSSFLSFPVRHESNCHSADSRKTPLSPQRARVVQTGRALWRVTSRFAGVVSARVARWSDSVTVDPMGATARQALPLLARGGISRQASGKRHRDGCMDGWKGDVPSVQKLQWYWPCHGLCCLYFYRAVQVHTSQKSMWTQLVENRAGTVQKTIRVEKSEFWTLVIWYLYIHLCWGKTTVLILIYGLNIFNRLINVNVLLTFLPCLFNVLKATFLNWIRDPFMLKQHTL